MLRENGWGNMTPDDLREMAKYRSEPMVVSGWPQDRAETYMLIATMRLAIGNALRDGSPRYAAATYALSEALFLQRQQQGSKGNLPKMLYFPSPWDNRLFRSLSHERRPCLGTP